MARLRRHTRQKAAPLRDRYRNEPITWPAKWPNDRDTGAVGVSHDDGHEFAAFLNLMLAPPRDPAARGGQGDEERGSRTRAAGLQAGSFVAVEGFHGEASSVTSGPAVSTVSGGRARSRCSGSRRTCLSVVGLSVTWSSLSLPRRPLFDIAS